MEEVEGTGLLDAGTTMKSKILLRIMVLLASIIVALETLLLIPNISSTDFESVGTLSTQTLSIILLQIVVLSCVIGIVSWIGLVQKGERTMNSSSLISIVLFIAGLLLVVEGLITINLNQSIMTGTTSVLILTFGLMMYALGALAMVSYVQSSEMLPRQMSTPFVATIAFILLMLPPAVLMT